MMRSMFSGVSGMRNFQYELDVIGNNISNVNTWASKVHVSRFKPLCSKL